MLALLGERLAHVTARANVPSILATGLKSVTDLARDAGRSPDGFRMRIDRPCVGPAKLNHQRPLARYRETAERLLEGHTPESWAAQLDSRVFFWTAREASLFAASLERELPAAILWFDTRSLMDALAPYIDVCPLNSGSFRQGGGGKPRGEWIYVPVTSDVETYRKNRQHRIDLKTPDTKIREISCRRDVPAQLVQHALVMENA